MKKKVCLPYIKFQTRYPKHLFFFILPSQSSGEYHSNCALKRLVPDQLAAFLEVSWSGSRLLIRILKKKNIYMYKVCLLGPI